MLYTDTFLKLCVCVGACVNLDVLLTLLYYHDQDAKPSYTVMIRPGAIPPSMIPIPAHLFHSDSDSSHLGYDSDSDSNTIFMNDSDSDSNSDSDSDSIPTPALLIF